MKIFKVKGHYDDGFFTRDSVSTMIIVAEDKVSAAKIFADYYDDGWGFAFNVSAEEIDGTEKGIVGVLYE